MARIQAGAPSSNFFLDGNFSPVAEERDTTDMKVIGTIPADLQGHFLRWAPIRSTFSVRRRTTPLTAMA